MVPGAREDAVQPKGEKKVIITAMLQKAFLPSNNSAS